MDEFGEDQKSGVDWFRIVPFIFLHLMCLTVFWVGWSWVAIAVAVGLYLIRMFAITGFYHRYFAHKAFKTSRWFQFVGALIGCAAAQRGPLWWASHHRNHHRRSDRPGDVHSPRQFGFWWSHMGWFLSRENFRTSVAEVAWFWPPLRSKSYCSNNLREYLRLIL